MIEMFVCSDPPLTENSPVNGAAKLLLTSCSRRLVTEPASLTPTYVPALTLTGEFVSKRDMFVTAVELGL